MEKLRDDDAVNSTHATSQSLAMITTGSPGHSDSMSAILDRLEAANFQAVRSSDKANNSLLSCFDPLLLRSRESPQIPLHVSAGPEATLANPNNICLIPDLSDSKFILPSENRCPQNPEGHLISPFTCNQNPQQVPGMTSNTPLSTGFTPVPSAIKQLNVSVSAGAASPYVFSPWMHRSVLDQAFGDGDHSPEWNDTTDAARTSSASSLPLSFQSSPPTSHSPANQVSEKSVSPGAVHVSVCHSAVTESSDLSQSYTSAVALSNAGDMDMLASLLERVNVRQDEPKSAEVTEIMENRTDLLQQTPDVPMPPLYPPGTYDVNPKPSRRTTDVPAGLISPQLTDSIETTPTVHPLPQIRRRTINLNSASLSAPVVDGAHTTTVIISEPRKSDSDHRHSGRISIGSISGIVTMAARSLYERIGVGGSSASTASESPDTAVPERNSHANDDSRPDIVQEDVQQSQQTKQKSLLPGYQSSPVNVSANATDPSVRSLDEDVWESVNSVHELHSTVLLDGPIHGVSGHPFQLSEENKENLRLCRTEISQPCYPSHQDRICGSMVNPAALDSNMITDGHISRSFTIPINGLHEISQVAHQLTASGDGPEILKLSVKSSDHEPSDLAAFDKEKRLLEDEISRLRVTATEIESTLNDYKRALEDGDVQGRERFLAAYNRNLQIAAERDEATEQATTMLKAYEDMYRRVQRAKETIEFKKERQKAALQCIDRYMNRSRAIGVKLKKLDAYYFDQLAECLATQERQQDEWHRKLDKLHLELRQHELRNATLTNEIRVKEQHCEELTKLSKKLFK